MATPSWTPPINERSASAIRAVDSDGIGAPANAAFVEVHDPLAARIPKQGPDLEGADVAFSCQTQTDVNTGGKG